jgi:hypothetical protein
MLDPKEEKRFEELRGMCRELKVPAPPEIMIGLKVHEGGVLTFDDVQRGHSWNRNVHNMILTIFSGCTSSGASFAAGNLTGRNTVPSIFTGSSLFSVSSGYDWSGGSGGIVVGTDNTAFTYQDVNLASEIGSGTGAGQLSYVAMPTLSTPSYNGGTKTWTCTISRIMNNNSGSSITVKEAGLKRMCINYNGSSSLYLLERSVLSPTVAVANGAQLTVTYEISMDFSAID